MAKIWETIIQQLIKQKLYILIKKAVVFKEFKYLRRIGHSRRPTGPLLWIDIANRGFLSY